MRPNFSKFFYYNITLFFLLDQQANNENMLIIILSFGTLLCLIAVCGGLAFAFRHKLMSGGMDDYEMSRRDAAKKQIIDPSALPFFGEMDAHQDYSRDMQLMRAMMIL